ncbi:MAG: hypothetical protein AB2689_02075 [Candidatus Thiodiazotropha taylori]
MMNRENASMGAAHPQEAKENALQNCSRFFNEDASFEIDRLTVELEDEREEKKAYVAAVAVEYSHVSSDFGAISQYISEVNSQSNSSLNSHCDVLSMCVDALTPSDHKETMSRVIESMRYMIYMHCHDMEETSSTAYSMMVKYLERCASDSVEEYGVASSNIQSLSGNGV